MAEEKVVNVSEKDLDASKKVESPTLDEVKGKTEGKEVKAPSIEDGLKPLMELLGAHDIKTPDDLNSLVADLDTYKKNYGDSRNEVGELRREVEELQAALQTKQAAGEFDEAGQDVNLEQMFTNALNKWSANNAKMQQEGQQVYLQQRAQVESRPNWGKVQPYFDKAMENPNVYNAIATGRMTMEGLYSRLSERLLMSTVNDFVKTLPDDVKLGQAISDVSKADRVVVDVPAETQRKEKIEKAVENKDVDSVLENMFPDNDPILRY